MCAAVCKRVEPVVHTMEFILGASESLLNILYTQVSAAPRLYLGELSRRAASVISSSLQFSMGLAVFRKSSSCTFFIWKYRKRPGKF